MPVHGNWCGPGHPKYAHGREPEPIDGIDAACRRHDKCYEEKGYLDCGCDIDLIRELKDSNSPQAQAVMINFTVVPCKGIATIFKPLFIPGIFAEELKRVGPLCFYTIPVKVGATIIETLWNKIAQPGEECVESQ